MFLVLFFLLMNDFVSFSMGQTKEKMEKNMSAAENMGTPEALVYQTVSYQVKPIASAPRFEKIYTIAEKRCANITETDKEVLCRIVQAEAGGEDAMGKQMVADVVLNRVKCDKFPDTVEDVVFQKSGNKAQFSPIADGRYYKVSVSQETQEAVEKALEGTDSTNGALYFVAAAKANAGNLSWFQRCLTLAASHGNHDFYK